MISTIAKSTVQSFPRIPRTAKAPPSDVPVAKKEHSEVPSQYFTGPAQGWMRCLPPPPHPDRESGAPMMAKASSTRSSPVQFLACVTESRQAPRKPANREMEEHVPDKWTLRPRGSRISKSEVCPFGSD